MNPRLALAVPLLASVALSSALAADGIPQRLTVATWNIEWFFDHERGDNYSELAKKLSAPNEAEWQWRLEGVAEAIARMRPDILALQEVENQRVLYQLCTTLKQKHGLDYHDAIVEGRDFYTEQDVAFLWRSGLVEYSRKVPTADEWNDPQLHSIPKHLIGQFEWTRGDQTERLSLINVHLQAFHSKESIRIRQARLLRRWFSEAIRRGENVIVLGDINTEESYSATAPDREVGILRGLNTPSTRDDLVDLHKYVPFSKRYTHLINRQFDRILVAPALMQDAPGRPNLVFQSVRVRHEVAVRGLQQDEDHWNMYYKIAQDERDLSDHYPVVAVFEMK
jgi:endonuclease/exonuclease/phosphatase family metal-dependent hydrolase